MSKQYFCDICGNELDKIMSIRDRHGELRVPKEGKDPDVVISLKVMSSAGDNDVCFHCVVSTMQAIISKREEVIQEKKLKEFRD